ncbi:MAG: S46 family peptidase, partial [Flavobacteriales bacterium]|nr:S46 family peptidase [Flavobacteriales bacterium]MDW8432368.1 S46 family peptidase [Flavobacteriales bacterium]
MLRKNVLLSVVSLSFLFQTLQLRADEGMWLPLYISKLQGRLKSMGCKLSAEDIYSVNKASIKDAIVSFGGFCTGEIVSPNGLVFTNHHCGYDAIADLSTVKNNYLRDGFWARSYAEELPVEGLKVRILQEMRDVTAEMKAAEDKEAKEKELTDPFTSKGLEASVESYFYGNEYYLLVYKVYKDIRLVGTPPESVGKFGGDTDNWMWPRHTGDFSIFRIYAGPDNEPAEYSVHNKPYNPKKFLPISLKGIKENDFAFIMGFPGNTQRYLTSDGIRRIIYEEYPVASAIMDVKLRTQKKFMDKDEAVKLQLASGYASLANYWKYMLGNISAAKNSDFIQKKEEFEKAFQAWVDADAERKKKYGTLIADLKNIYNSNKEEHKLQSYLMFGFLGPDFARRASRLYGAAMQLKDEGPIPEALQKTIADLKKKLNKTFDEYNATVDIAVTTELLKKCLGDLPESRWPAVFTSDAFQIMPGNTRDEKIESYARWVIQNSLFCNKEKMKEFLDNPKGSTLRNDPGFAYVKDVIALYISNMGVTGADEQAEQALMSDYIAAMRAFQKDKFFYPDANSTLRFTFGSVKPYKPRDAVFYDYITTAKGILEKEIPGDLEFDVPARLHTLIQNKDFGPYADGQGQLVTCFLTTTDITGGNSGSPVINGKGELIGIAFDGNWESMIGDLSYQPAVQRTISVDIRYVLWFIDK